MIIADRELDAVQILSVTGRLDASTAPLLQTRVEQHISTGKRLFVLDLQGVDYVSSGGLRALLIVTKKVKPLAGGVVLSNLHPFVEDLLTMAGFNKLIPTAATEEDAVKLLAAGGTA
jgi:anti-anti-sigma factor